MLNEVQASALCPRQVVISSDGFRNPNPEIYTVIDFHTTYLRVVNCVWLALSFLISCDLSTDAHHHEKMAAYGGLVG